MMTVVYAMAKIVVALVLGFCLYKGKILDDHSNSVMSRLVLEITCPCMVFYSVCSMEDTDKSSALIVLIAGVAVYVVLAVIALITARCLGGSKQTQGVNQCIVLFGNVGFMGLPVAETLYGSEGVFYMALLNIHLNLVFFSYGLYLMTKYNDGKFKFNPKKLLNSGIVAVLIALFLYLGNVHLPDLVLTPIQFVGSLTSPLAMIVLGSSIATYPLKKVFSQWKTYILAALRLIILPVLTFCLSRLIIGPGIITKILTIYVGMPTATVVSMTALAYKGDVDTATYGCGLTTILSILTIPALYIMMLFLS